MRINKIQEAALAQYLPEPKVSRNKYTFTKSKGSTLEEFYNEVYAKSAFHEQQSYHNKNAQEIESMMMQNRRLIETQRNPRR